MTFLTPLGLLLAGLAVPLTALYFVRLRRRRVQVPSLLLWHASKRSRQLATPFERFRRHWLYWLQLLCMLLLALVLGRLGLPSGKAPGETFIIVIDSTASMGATDVKPSRFEIARIEALNAINSMPSNGEVMILNAGPRPTVALSFTRDKSMARDVMKSLTVTDAEGSLKDALRLAARLSQSRPESDALLLSDGSRERLDGLDLGTLKVRFQPIGVSADNVGITALSLRRSATSSLEQQAFVTIENFSSKQQQSTIELYFNDRLSGVRKETLKPSGDVSVIFELPTGGRGTLRAKVTAQTDHLATDDEAYAIVNAQSNYRVLLVGGDRLTAHALKADPRVELSQIPTWPDSGSVTSSYDCIVFGAELPKTPPHTPYLVLGPYPNSPVDFGEVEALPTVSKWKRDHPVSRLIQWDAGNFAKRMKVNDSKGLQSVVETSSGPLVLAGESNGTRVVQLTFDPLMSDLPLRISWPVFLFNSVGWLTTSDGVDAESQQAKSGQPVLINLPQGTKADQVVAQSPDGTALTPIIRGGRASLTQTHQTGIYKIEGPTFSKQLALNLLSKRESNIAPQSALPLPPPEASVSKATVIQGHRELWRPLLLTVVLLMLFEWFLFHRRRIL